MGQFAENTTVSAEKSRAEIESTLGRYGATSFMYGWQQPTPGSSTGPTQAVVGFVANDRQIKFLLDMPDRNDPVFRFTPGKKIKRSDAQAEKEWEQATRQRWRALALVIKAKLEAVESGITEFEDEFLAHIVLPDGTTAGTWMRPQIAEAYETGAMPQMMPQLGSGVSS